jgi:hypothetical protein
MSKQKQNIEFIISDEPEEIIIDNDEPTIIYQTQNIEDDINKQLIIDKFMTNVKHKEIFITSNLHCGSEGHWLETQMGIIHNANNEPDILGYEMKKNSSKITFGDFSASEYLFSNKKKLLKQ